MVNEYLTRAYDTKVIFRELLCFYAPFGWVPVKENRAPSPNPPVHKMYDGNTVWSMEKQDYVSDYDVGRKRSEKIVIKRNTKFTRNNRLMTEEALMEYHLRWRYWLYPRCNRLRLINRCRPFWGSLWALFFLVFASLTLMILSSNPTLIESNIAENNAIVCDFSEDTVYYWNAGDSSIGTAHTGFYKVTENKVYYTESLSDDFTVCNTALAKVNGEKIQFSIVKGKAYAYVSLEPKIDFPEMANFYFSLFGKMYLKESGENFLSALPLISYIFLGFNFVMLVYQIFSNRQLKKNTERIIECCVNGKAIVKAMQYEDITLMNGRQRQRYYQGQVINEAARNTGDPLYFGS